MATSVKIPIRPLKAADDTLRELHRHLKDICYHWNTADNSTVCVKPLDPSKRPNFVELASCKPGESFYPTRLNVDEVTGELTWGFNAYIPEDGRKYIMERLADYYPEPKPQKKRKTKKQETSSSSESESD